MKILTVSDKTIEQIYSTAIKEKFSDIDLVLGCGDLPYYYLEYIIDMLDVPLYYVRGNHGNVVEYTSHGERTEPWGAIDLHHKMVNHQGLILVGFEGSLRYRAGPFQYSQFDMWLAVWLLVPRLILNRLRYGRYLDVVISHAPPWQVNDQNDRAHQGFKALRWLLRVFKPRYHFHGHIHVYHTNSGVATQFESTAVINTYGYRVTEIDINRLDGQE